MPYIIVDDDQAKMIAEAGGQVEIRDQSGRQLGYVAVSFSAAEIVESRRRLASDETRHTTHDVLEHLQKLER